MRRTGAANWRYALLFRDWLRANDSWRDDYATTKVHLAEMHANDSHFDDYARAKDFWFDRAYDPQASAGQPLNRSMVRGVTV